jgi:hypothetical protein
MSYKQKRKASIRRGRPQRGPKGLTRGPAAVRPRPGLSYPVRRGAMGRGFAEDRS